MRTVQAFEGPERSAPPIEPLASRSADRIGPRLPAMAIGLVTAPTAAAAIGSTDAADCDRLTAIFSTLQTSGPTRGDQR